jgi:hypothetical protein
MMLRSLVIVHLFVIGLALAAPKISEQDARQAVVQHRRMR